jgi:ankyrin repeat protein
MQLKKQAKELLAAIAAGKQSALAEARRFELRVQPADFSLNDAQRVLARAYGFESWPKLKAFVDGITVRSLADAVKAGDVSGVREMLRKRPELVHIDLAETDEHRALHYAVLARNAEMTRLLMAGGADARKGIYPHRDATTAYAIARDREYRDIVAIIEDEEQRRREEMSCPNATVSPVQDQINDAIRQGRNAEAIGLLEADSTLIRACDRGGNSPLHVAAEVLNVEMVQWLVDRNADAKKLNLASRSPLEVAVHGVRWRSRASREQFPAVASLLIRRGCEVTPLAAAAMGDVDRLRNWRIHEPSRLGECKCILETAVIFGQYETLKFLLDCGLDPDERKRVEGLEEEAYSWGGPLWHAAAFGEHAMAELLLERGADPNGNVYASGWPMMHAYDRKDQRMKELLFRRGARVDPYVIATNHDLPAARALVAAGDQPCEDTTSYGCRTVLETLLWGACNAGDAEIAAMCLPHIRRAPDDVWWNGMLEQPMRLSDKDIIRKHPECLRLMLEAGANPNLSRRFGQRPIHFLCARVSHPEAQVAFGCHLLDAGARLDVRDEMLRSTPLGWACRWGRIELVKLFLDRGADANEADAEAWATPIAWARKGDRLDIVELLEKANKKAGPSFDDPAVQY